MAAEKKTERPPKDLSVPETMKIAALLAELMPPGVASSKTSPVSLAPEDGADDPATALVAPSLQVEDLDDLDSVGPGVAPPLPVAEQTIIPGLPATPPITPRPPALPRLSAKRILQAPEPLVESIPEPIKAVEPEPQAEPQPEPQAVAGPEQPRQPEPILDTEPPAQPAAAVEAAPPAAAVAHDPDLIPLGDLSTQGYFSLVNWRNDPARVRHPRRADYGLDEQTLSQARRNPFYVIGRPRRPESQSVAEVFTEIAWE